jgi:hypothetical protein
VSDTAEILYGHCASCNRVVPLRHGTLAPHDSQPPLRVYCYASNQAPAQAEQPDPGQQGCPRHGDWYLETMPCTCTCTPTPAPQAPPLPFPDPWVPTGTTETHMAPAATCCA